MGGLVYLFQEVKLLGSDIVRLAQVKEISSFLLCSVSTYWLMALDNSLVGGGNYHSIDTSVVLTFSCS